MTNKCKYHSKCEHIGEECYEPFASQCVFYKRFKKQEPRARTGLERFLLKFPFYEVKKQKVENPEYLGIGAMVIVPGEGLK